MNKAMISMLPKRKLLFLICFLFSLLIPALIAQASDLRVERTLQKNFKKSRVVLAKIERAFVSGKSYQIHLTELKGLGESIRSEQQALHRQFSSRAVQINVLGANAVSRHKTVRERYEQLIPQYLSSLDAISNSQVSMAEILQLQDILNEILPKRKRRIHGSTPYRHLNLPARLPTNSPEIVPAYRGGTQTFAGADLAASPEAPVSLPIAELAESLNWNPVEIYEWVKNNIETEWYWGVMKGAEETLRQKSGNDADQAALLVALFRSAGFPARYVRGVMEFFPGIEAAKEQTGLDDPLDIARFFQKAGIPYETVIAGGGISNFRIEHIWVEVLIPYDNYRGAIIDEHGQTWLPLDTSIKVAGYTERTPADALETLDFTGIRESWLTGFKAESPLEYLAAQSNNTLLENGSGITYGDLLLDRAINQEHMKIIPAGLQFTEIAITGEFASLPDELLHKARFSAAAPDGTLLFEQTIPLYALSNRSIAVTFEPETIEDQEIMNAYGGLDNTPLYLIHLRPILTVDGSREIVGQGGIAAGSDFSLGVDLIAPAASERIENILIAGYPAVIGLSAGQAILPAAVSLQETNAERLLFERAMAYIDQGNRTEAELASLLQLQFARPLPTLVTLSGVLDVVYLLGSVHGFDWKGVYLDADLRIVEPVGGVSLANGDPVSLFMQLASLQNSFLENLIFEEGFGVESVSTAKLLGFAAEEGVPVVAIDAANIQDVLPPLFLPESINDDIVNGVNQGFVITIPETELLYEDWFGFAYIKENPATFESGWMLSGEIAGGMTALNPDRWPEESSDILANPMVESSEDPLSVVEIKVIKGLDLLAGTAGQQLESPLQVVALDQEGKRVKGVDVVFTVKEGGAKIGLTGNWQTQITVTTGYDGIAVADLLFGQSTSTNPTVKKITDEAAQKVDETVIEVTTTSGLQTDAPISVYGFPDVPHHLRVTGGNGTGSILSWAATLLAYVEDQYNNPVNGENVNFAMGAAQLTSPCSSSNNDDRQGLLVTATDLCMSSIPVYGDCGSNAITAVTGLHTGAVAQVILGGLPGAEYPITVTSGSLASEIATVSSSLTGVCDEEDAPYSALALKVIHASDSFGNIINGGAAGSTIPLYARIYFVREEGKTIERDMPCSPSGTDTCPVDTGTGVFYTDTDFVAASVTFGGTAAVHLGNGLFKVDYPLSPSATKHEIGVVAEATERIKITANICDENNDCQLIDSEKESPPVTHNTEVYAVNVLVPQVKHIIPLNENGFASYDYAVEYRIEPPEYVAGTAYFVLSKEVTPGVFEEVAYFNSNTSGVNQMTFLRGFYFDLDTAYKAQVVLNKGSDYMEVKSTEILLTPLTVELDADLNSDGTFSEDDPLESIAPGLVISLNSDDDDQDGVPDYLDGFNLDPAIPEDDSFADPANPDLVDDDLIAIKLHGLPVDFNEGTVTLEIINGQDKIRVLADNKKENGIASILIDTTDPDATATQDPIAATYAWQLGSTETPTMKDLPPFIYIEGINASVTPGDIQLEISFTSMQGAKGKLDALVLTVVQVDMKVDEDRDGKIVFDDPDSPESKYTFWVNDDNDMEVREDGEWHEDDEEDYYNIPDDDQDCNDDYIGQSEQLGVNGNKRDLEDFAMIQLRVPKVLYDNQDLTYSFKFDNVVEDDGSKPSINLFKAVSELSEYLSVKEEAEDQIKEKKLLFIHSDDETPIAKEDILPDGETTPFIFEGCSKGTGDLKFLIKNGDNVVFEASVHLELHDILWFYDEFKVDVSSGSTWQAEVEDNYHPVNKSGYRGDSNDYFLFVHGWNLKEAEKKRWAEMIFKRFWWQGYKGEVGFFNWPCRTWVEWLPLKISDPNNFNNSEFLAWQSAESLTKLLQDLKGSQGKKLAMLAHSQGNIVAGEALANYPSGAENIDAYIASQAAISASLYDNRDVIDNAALSFAGLINLEVDNPRIYGHYDTGGDLDEPYFYRLEHRVEGHVTTMWNFYNETDFALKESVWELNNVVMKPWYQFRHLNRDGNIELFDETQDAYVRFELVSCDENEPCYEPTKISIDVDKERYQIFSYIAGSRKRALGTQKVEGGFDGCVDLKDKFGFNKEHYSHSRQFRSNIIKERSYWREVLSRGGLGYDQ